MQQLALAPQRYLAAAAAAADANLALGVDSPLQVRQRRKGVDTMAGKTSRSAVMSRPTFIKAFGEGIWKHLAPLYSAACPAERCTRRPSYFMTIDRLLIDTENAQAQGPANHQQCEHHCRATHGQREERSGEVQGGKTGRRGKEEEKQRKRQRSRKQAELQALQKRLPAPGRPYGQAPCASRRQKYITSYARNNQWDSQLNCWAW